MGKIKLKNQWYFGSINDLIYTLKEAPVISDRRNGSADDGNGGRWCDTKDYEEAEKCMLGGRIYEDIYKYTYKQLNKQNNKKNKQNYGVQGYNVCVPLYLNGVPECMITSKKIINNKIYNIVYNSSVAGYVSGDRIVEATKKVITRVIELEKRGVRVNLYITSPADDDNTIYTITTKIKGCNEKLNIKKICFPLCSSSFERRIYFRCAERLFKDDITNNYGGVVNTSVSSDSEIKKLKKILTKQISTDNFEMWDINGNCDDEDKDDEEDDD